jgi:hypothetical protein
MSEREKEFVKKLAIALELHGVARIYALRSVSKLIEVEIVTERLTL